MQIVEINRNGINNQTEIIDLQDELNLKKRQLTEQGVTEIQLFVQTPVFASILIGSTFRNWVPVKIYHKTQVPPPEIYEYQTILM